MAGIRRIVLDVLIPNNIPVSQVANKISNLAGVEGVDITILEVERRAENAKITIEGDNIDFEAVKKTIDTIGASLQSIDRISSGKRLVG